MHAAVIILFVLLEKDVIGEATEEKCLQHKFASPSENFVEDVRDQSPAARCDC